MSEEIQQTADQVNLGAHQHPVAATDEAGQVRQFVIHRPTMGDAIKIAVNASLFVTVATQGTDAGATVGRAVAVPDDSQALAEAVATLNQVIDMRPAGVPADVSAWTDEILLGNLWSAFLGWRNSFRVPVPPPVVADSSPAEPAAPGMAV